MASGSARLIVSLLVSRCDHRRSCAGTPPPRLYLGKQEPPSAETLMLRLRRCRRDFDIEEIARRSGVPRSTLYRILDKPTDVHIRRIAQLARGLGREPSWFIVALRR